MAINRKIPSLKSTLATEKKEKIKAELQTFSNFFNDYFYNENEYTEAVEILKQYIIILEPSKEFIEHLKIFAGLIDNVIDKALNISRDEIINSYIKIYELLEKSRNEAISYTWVNPPEIENQSNPKSEAFKTQVGGTHYKKYKIQPTEFIIANRLEFVQGNIIKYVVRYRDKNGLEDLLKAKHYLEMLIESEKKNTNK